MACIDSTVTRRLAASTAAALVIVVAGGAAAQTTSSATVTASASSAPDSTVAARRQLIEDAEVAWRGGDEARSLELAERAAALGFTPSLRLFIAQRQRGLGRIGEAYANATLCAREAEHDSSLHNREVVVEACTALAGTLRDSMARITLRVAQPAPEGLRVVVGSTPIPASLWGVPYLLPAGSTTVEASAPGRMPFHRVIELAAQTEASVDVDLAPVVAPVVTERRRSNARGASRAVPGWVFVGTGAASLIASATLRAIIAAESPQCPDNMCSDAATANRLNDYGTGVYTTLGVGAGLAVAGIVWLIVERATR